MMSGRPRRGKVLVVDDDPVALLVVRERLENAGFEVITRDVALGTSAVVQKEQPDIILLDVSMPTLSGTALAKLIVDKGADLPVILHSSSDAETLQRLAAECGAVGVITKTSDDAAFLAQFDRFLSFSKRFRRF